MTSTPTPLKNLFGFVRFRKMVLNRSGRDMSPQSPPWPRHWSNVPNHFDHDLDDVDNIILNNNQLDSYLTVQEAQTLSSGKNEECSFSTMCVNARSLTNSHNFAKFKSLISGLNYQPHIIADNETWENPILPFNIYF